MKECDKKVIMVMIILRPIKNRCGFTLVELLVVMAIFLTVLAITGNAFNLVEKYVAREARTGESNIEGVIGLELMLKDLASSGFGLPTMFNNAIAYQEAADTEDIAKVYNDPSGTGVPRAIYGGNNVASADISKLLNGSDYLVVRASSIGGTTAAQCWSYMNYTGMTKKSPLVAKSWSAENLHKGDLVLVESMDVESPFNKTLITNSVSGDFYTRYPDPGGTTLLNFEPQTSKLTYYIYGVYRPNNGDVTSLRMPFNRADYYVRRPAAGEAVQVPGRCAPNTGLLFKALVSQSDGTLRGSELPLLDCVADMQVVYSTYSDTTGVITDTDTPLASVTDIRTSLKTVRVFVLTHDGGKDPNYTYPNRYIAVGPSADGITTGTGRTFDLQSIVGSGWQNYRWKVYKMTTNLTNLNVSTD